MKPLSQEAQDQIFVKASGFDNAKVDAVFFGGTMWKSNFLCNLGYGDTANIHPRLPRLAFAEACRIL